MVDLHQALGAGPPAGTLQVTLFIPSVDHESQPIAQEIWSEDGLKTLGTLFRGATAFPPGRGVWRDDSRGGRLVFDDTVMITAFVDPGDLDSNAAAGLRNFLHRLGREANQGEVGVVIGGNYYGITVYDAEDKQPGE